ncbi:MAG TPA: stage III sporulation protein AD [Candidatus Anaerobutyricum avicola]|nr:stage III sporulation protein AD [Candidatus Anaerobutyricum avicola]
MVILKIALIAIGGAILALVVRQFQKEYSVFVLLAVCLFLIAYLTSNVSVIVEFAENLGEKIQISDAYIKILFKLMGIAFTCQIASNICQDLGYQSIAFQVEVIGKISIFILSIPIINSLLETIESVI